jgi:carbon monoxide dehydrogenase subunit G
MRFEGTRTLAAPITTVWVALRTPDVLETLMPYCERVERQPGYRPASDSDFTMSFELGAPEQGQRGRIIGWLEVDRQRPPHHLSLTLTLNDALVLMHVEGTIDLTARDHGQSTELHYHLEAQVPGMRGVGWSAEVHSDAQRLIGAMLDRLAEIVQPVAVGQAVQSIAEGRRTGPSSSPQVLLETQRGSVVLLPPVAEVPAPTQSMLRHMQRAQARRQERQQRGIAAIVTLSTLTVASGVLALWQWRHSRG